MKIVGWTNGTSFYSGEKRPGEGTNKAKDWRPLTYADENVTKLEFPLFVALMDAAKPAFSRSLPEVLDEHVEYFRTKYFDVHYDSACLVMNRVSGILKEADKIIKEWELGNPSEY